MASLWKRMTQPGRAELPFWAREQFDAVAAGRSAHLDLGDWQTFEPLTEVPAEIKELKGLQLLRLGASQIRELPPWLGELEQLQEIDASTSDLKEVPDLPGVRWAVSADTLLRCAETLDPRAVVELHFAQTTTGAAIRAAQAFAAEGRLSLRRVRAGGSVTVSDGPAESAARWAALPELSTAIDEILSTQPSLDSVNIWGCPLGRIPDGLQSLSAVRNVSLAGLWPEDLPDWLFELPAMDRLDLSHNGLSELPPALSRAQRLGYLSLSFNPLTVVPDAVWDLAALTELNLQNCPIEYVTAGILRLTQLADLQLGDVFKRAELYTEGRSPVPDELVVPPPEIAVQGLEAIKQYWRQEQEVGVDYLTEAKLLIVGEPGAGKTTLAKKILNPSYGLDAREVSTEGIDVSTWQFPTVVRVRDDDDQERPVERDFRVNVWDFGGQEIYHATHQFFLTKRSVYALVTDERKEDTDFEYWLEIVNLLSDSSPLLVVQNQKQGRGHGVDLGALRLRFPNLAGAVPVDLADNSGLDDMLSRLRRELEQLPHVGTALPSTWRKVRKALEADPREYISADEFFDVCEHNGFTRREDMSQLGGYLHDLGICLFFQDDPVLRQTVILKPEWGTDAVYRVLDDPAVATSLGEFSTADLHRIWSAPSHAEMRHELLQLMVRFGLCFPVPGTDAYVAPQLLSPSRPAYDWPEEDNLVLHYEYDVMPKGIVRRIIVGLHDHIRRGDYTWRNGAVFDYEGTAAEVVEDYRRRRLRIRLTGGDPRVLLALIDHSLAVIHRSFPGIKFEKYRPCDCPECLQAAEPTMFSVRDLYDFAKSGDGIQCRVSRRLMDPVALLRTMVVDLIRVTGSGSAGSDELVVSPGDVVSEPIPSPEVYISYRWGGQSAEVVEEVQAVLGQRGVAVIRDVDEMRYKDSIREFMGRLGAGKAVVVVLGAEYLKSKNCMFELCEIAARPEFTDRVFPVILEDAQIFDAVARLEYVRYWEEQTERLRAAMNTVGQENLQGIRDELDLFVRIRNTLPDLIDTIADMNTLTPQMHRGSNFEALYRSLEPVIGPLAGAGVAGSGD